MENCYNSLSYVDVLPRNDSYGCITVFIMVCHLTKMAHFVPCNKEITEEESADLSISNCNILHGVANVLVSDGETSLLEISAKLYAEIKYQIKYE